MTTLLPRGTGTRTAAQPRAAQRPGQRPSVSLGGGRVVAPAPPIRTPLVPAFRSGTRLPFVALILVLLGGGLCALLALNTASAAGEVQERQLGDQARTLADSEQDLRRQVAAVEAPAALASAAEALGMVPGVHPAFLVIGPDATVTVLGDPQAAQPPVAPPAPVASPAPSPAPDPSATPAAAPSADATLPVPGPAPTPEPSPAPQPSVAPQPTPVAAVPTVAPAGQ